MAWLDDSTVGHLRQVLQEDPAGDGRYHIGEQIGQGGMGTVYLAQDTALGRAVALKVLREGGLGADAVDRMLGEARVIARLEHPGIVPVHDVGRLPDGRVFYVMKWVRGHRLDQHFDAAASIQERLRVFQRVCETIAFAHARGVIHRDLKPQNVMVGEFGEVLVLDWGVAKQMRASSNADAAAVGHGSPPRSGPEATESPTTARKTAFGTILGTPAYMPPEQARGEVDRIDERSDVFALGGILYFLLTGRSPRCPENSGDVATSSVVRSPRSLNRAVPRRLDAIGAKAMAWKAEGRYATASELAADVARFLDGQAVSAYREGPFERLRRWTWRYQAPILLVAAYLLMRAALILWQRR